MVSGIICEFNPFHNGHKYLLKKAKENSNAVICVMSGNLVQRGEIALYPKHIRAQMALENGADIVISLPSAWSMSGAENFAYGGISILNSCKIVDNIVFGCEDCNVNQLLQIAEVLFDGKADKLIKEYLSTGITYAAARTIALEELLPLSSEVIKKPNNILAIEYLIAIKKLNMNANINPVKRIGAEHDSVISSNSVSSASNIRELIKNNDMSNVSKFVPESVLDIISNTDYADEKRLENAFLYKLRSMNKDDFAKLPDISEGLENSIYSAVKTESSYNGILNRIKSKRYTLARLRRMLMSACFDIDNSFLKQAPPYMHILGFSKTGESLIPKITDVSPIPVILSTKDLSKLNDFGKKVFESESKIADLYSLSFTSPLPSGTEFTNKIIKTN